MEARLCPIVSNSVTEGAEIIVQVSLAELRGITLDISPVATPGRLRLISCGAFLDDEVLSIWEFPEFPAVAYAAISYVWKGNPARDSDNASDRAAGYFKVKGAEDGDDISIDVLRYACLAAQRGAKPRRGKDFSWVADYLWMDRVCIIQTSKPDKSWQITRMFDIYKLCSPCIVLPGGVGRVVPLEEETAWVHRAWTLQEALAPSSVFLLFAWEWGTGVVEDPVGGSIGDKLEIIVPGHCALLPLDVVVTACLGGQLDFIPDQLTDLRAPASWKKYSWHGAESGRNVTGYTVPVAILGARSPPLVPLDDALSLSHAPDSETREYAVWQSALARTSSRPVDMVFSIMGLFGVTLDPAAFPPHDRMRATVALARAILSQGRRAIWLGVAPRMAPCASHSAFPDSPRTSVGGRAEVEMEGGLIDAAALVEGDTFSSLYPYAKDMMDDMDAEGYVCVTRRASVIVPTTQQASRSTNDPGDIILQTLRGSRWKALETLDIKQQSFPRAVAIWLGSFSKSRLVLTSEPLTDRCSKFMLVQEHAPGKFHVLTFAILLQKDPAWDHRTKQWQAHAFRIGSPDQERLIERVGEQAILAIAAARTPPLSPISK